MLDRFPTELISLVIDATSSGAWQRKAMFDSLSLVSKAYRSALRPLQEGVVHVPKASVIPILRSWSKATTEAVVTVLSRLLSILLNIKYIYLQRVQDSESGNGQEIYPCTMWFELKSSNPFRECLTLSLLRSQWQFPPTLQIASFKLRQLRLDFASGEPGANADASWGPGLDQFLTTQRPPCLRELRLSSCRLPEMSTDFVNQLHAAQFDIPPPTSVQYSLGRAHQVVPFSAPVLFSFDTGSFGFYRGPQVKGIVFAHLQVSYTGELLEVIRLLPDLKALSFEILRPTFSTRDLGSLDHSSVADTIKNVKDRSIELFASATEDNDFVDRGFLDFLRSRGSRS